MLVKTMWKAPMTAFFISGLIFWLPFIVWSDLFAGRLATAEIIALLFWCISLMIAGFLFCRHEKKKPSLISVVLGFSLASLLRLIISLWHYPVPFAFYLSNLFRSLIFSAVASALGVLIGSLVYKRREPLGHKDG